MILLRRLEPDPIRIEQDMQLHEMQMMRDPNLAPYILPDFSPPWRIEAAIALVYVSLSATVLVIFATLLIGSWVRKFSCGLRMMSIPERRARTREFRYLGMKHRMITEMIGVLPSLVQMSILGFSIGLGLFVSHISILLFSVTAATLSIGYTVYLSA